MQRSLAGQLELIGGARVDLTGRGKGKIINTILGNFDNSDKYLRNETSFIFFFASLFFMLRLLEFHLWLKTCKAFALRLRTGVFVNKGLTRKHHESYFLLISTKSALELPSVGQAQPFDHKVGLLQRAAALYGAFAC